MDCEKLAALAVKIFETDLFIPKGITLVAYRNIPFWNGSLILRMQPCIII